MADWWKTDAIVEPAASGATPRYGPPPKPEKPEDPLDRRSKELDVTLKEQRVAKGEPDASDPMGLAKVEQVKASGFLERALHSNALYGEGVQPRGALGQTAFELLPKNFRNEQELPERRITDKFAEEFIAAVLRYESGAAIPDPELDRAYRRYFPMAGDGPSEMAAKAKLREVAINGLRAGAGPLGEPITAKFESGKADLAAFRESVLSDKPKTDEDFRAGLENRISRGDSPEKVIKWLVDNGRPPTEDQIARIVANAGNADPIVRPPEFAQRLSESTGNVLTGMAQGAVMLPDMLAKQAGKEMGDIADLLGYDEAARGLRNPLQIGDILERNNPQPESGMGWWNREGAKVAGGVLGVPARATTALTEFIAGKAPTVATAPALGPVGRTAQEAADRLNVRMLPADVGGETSRGLTSAASQAPLSRGPIVRAVEEGSRQLQNAASRTAATAGRVLPEDEAGESVRRGGVQYIRNITDRGSRWYDKANEWAGNMRIMPQKGIEALDRHIAETKEAGEIAAPMVAELEKLRRTLDQTGGITVTGLRKARSILGGLARSDQLRGTDAKRIFGEVLDAASEDMTSALIAAGKGNAARMFSRADTLWRGRIETIDEVLEPIIGKTRSGEDILRSVEGMTRGRGGGVRRLQRVLDTLPKEEKGDVIATVIDRMGRASASAQDDTGSLFSSEAFLTNWNKMSDKGKRALFGRGEMRRNLDDIALIAAAKRGTNRISSRSNTPVGVAANLGVIGGVATVSPQAAIVGAITQVAGGRLLASPRFTRWLAQMPAGETGIAKHLGGLDKLARADPVIANDITALVQQFGNTQTVTRAAASEVEGDDNEQR